MINLKGKEIRNYGLDCDRNSTNQSYRFVEIKDITSGNKGIAGHIRELRRTCNVEKDEQILDTLDELAKETMGLLKKKRISLTVEDFLGGGSAED